MIFFTNDKRINSKPITKLPNWRTIRLLTVLFIFTCSETNAEIFSQNVTIIGKDLPLKKVFSIIKQQTGYVFLYNKEDLNKSKKVTLDFKNVPVQTVLQKIAESQSFTFDIDGKNIILIQKVDQRIIDQISDEISFKKRTLTGKVTGEKGEPIAGVTISLRNGKILATTNEAGEFSLADLDENAVIVVTSISHEPITLSTRGRNTLDVELKARVGNLDETIVVAYNTTTQRTNTGAVTVIKGEQIQNLPNRSLDKNLQGLVPGLLVTSGNGQPGSAPSNFMLRGIATGGQQGNGGYTFRNPLIVIDGVPVFQDPPNSFYVDNVASDGSPLINPMAQLNPSDIESITVLKDAAAVALYGSRASNGVLLVVTKRGKAGKTVYNFRHQTDISGRMDGGVKTLSQEEYLELVFEAEKNSNPWKTDEQIKSDLFAKFPYKVGSNGDTTFYPAADWMDALYNKAALTMSNEISMSGGKDRSNFYLNLEYTKQDGIAKNSGYDRKSIRFNYENRPGDGFKIGLNTTLSYSDQTFNNAGTFNNILQISPLNPIYDDAGEYIYNYGWGLSSSSAYLTPNPVAVTKLNINRNIAYRGLANLYGEVKFLKYFTFTSNAGVNFSLNEIKEKIHPSLAIDGDLDYGGTLKQGNHRNVNIITTNTLRFNLVAQKHNINAVFGQEAQVINKKSTEIYKYNFLNDPSQDQLTSGEIFRAFDVDGKQALLSYFGQVNYGFLNRYFLSGSTRADGSSLFGKNERFGTYWSIGGGWLLSEEPFLKRTIPWINYLKLRGSFGPAGNSSAIIDNMRYNYLNRIGANVVMEDHNSDPGNPSIQWEKTTTWDAGIELKVLNERVAITADIYTRKTTNLLASDVPLPLITGYTNFTSNVGDIKNKGVELSVSGILVSLKNFSWNISANWSRNTNRLIKSLRPQEGAGGSLINKVGEEYNSFYLPKWAGVNPANGRPMWIDSAGKPNEDFMAAGRIIVGKAQPDGFGSVSSSFLWKGLAISGMLYYQYGSHILYNGELLQNDGLNPYVNQSKTALNRWRKPGDIAENPRRLLNGFAGSERDRGTEPSTRFLYKGDFIRLSNVKISYNFTKVIQKAISFNNLVVFIQGHNLATWTPYTGQDPENVSSNGNGNFLYPQQRSFSIGLNASF